MSEDKNLLKNRNVGIILYRIVFFMQLVGLFIVEKLENYPLPLLIYSTLACILWSMIGRQFILILIRSKTRKNDNLCIWKKDKVYLVNKSFFFYSLISFPVSLLPFGSMLLTLYLMKDTYGFAGTVDDKFGVVIMLSALGLMICNATTFISSILMNYVDSSLKKLRNYTPESISAAPIIYVKNESNFDLNTVNKLTVIKRNLEVTERQYLMEEAELNKIFAGRHGFEAASYLISRWCYIVQIESEEELKIYYDRVYKERNQQGSGLETSVILNYNPKRIPFNLPEEYKNMSFISYMEIHDRNEISFMDIWNCGGGKGDNAVSENNNLNSFEESQASYFFQHPEAFLQRINSKKEFRMDYNGANTWLLDFYKNACIFENQSRSIMAMLDYMELFVRLVSIYYNKKASDKESEDDLIKGSFFTIAKYIVRNSGSMPQKQEKLKSLEYTNSELFRKYLKHLNEYLYISFQGATINFMGLISLIQIIRNKVVAHGVINEMNAPIVWGLLFYSSVILNNFLDVNEFQLIEQNNGYLIGYGEDLVEGGNLLICKDGFPCIASVKKKNKAQTTIFVNYFNGELIIPEYVTANS